MAVLPWTLTWKCEHAGVLRIGAKHWKPGDPWLWRAFIFRVGETADIEGVNEHAGRDIWQTVRAALKANGFALGGFDRVKDGETRYHVKRL